MPEKKNTGGAPARLPETEPPPPPAPDTLDAQPIEPAPIVTPEPIAEMPPEKTPKEWAKAKGTEKWQLAAASAGEVWPSDKVLSEQAFDDALQRALGAQSG